MEHVDARRALELLTDLVDQYGPEYVYEGPLIDLGDHRYMHCQYQVEGQPSCAVGHVLARAGVEQTILADLDTRMVSPTNFAAEGLDLTPEAELLLSEFQFMQDQGKAWGVCLDLVREMYEDMQKEEL